MSKIRTVGDLITSLKNYPTEMEVFHITSKENGKEVSQIEIIQAVGEKGTDSIGIDSGSGVGNG